MWPSGQPIAPDGCCMAAMLNPVIGKSLVLYARKPAVPARAAA